MQIVLLMTPPTYRDKKAGASDPYEDYDALLKKFTESQKEKDELQRELQRLRDQLEIIKMKNSSVPQGNENNQQAQGYQFIHLLLVALVALVIGAFLK